KLAARPWRPTVAGSIRGLSLERQRSNGTAPYEHTGESLARAIWRTVLLERCRCQAGVALLGRRWVAGSNPAAPTTLTGHRVSLGYPLPAFEPASHSANGLFGVNNRFQTRNRTSKVEE